MLTPNCVHTSHCFSISARSAALSGYGMFFWKPKAGATKLTGMPSTSHSASIIGGRLGRGQAGQLVDGQLAEVARGRRRW